MTAGNPTKYNSHAFVLRKVKKYFFTPPMRIARKEHVFGRAVNGFSR